MRHRGVTVPEVVDGEEEREAKMPSLRIWVTAVVFVLIAGVAATILMAGLSQYVQLDPYVLPSSKGHAEAVQLRNFIKTDFQTNMNITSSIGPTILRDVCVSKGAGIIVLRRRDDLLTAPITKGNRLPKEPHGPFITEVSTSEVKEFAVPQQPCCFFVTTAKSDSPALALYEIGLPLIRKSKLVCKEGDTIVLLAALANKWLSSLELAELLFFTGVHVHVVLTSTFLEFHPPFVFLEKVHLLEEWDFVTPSRDDFLFGMSLPVAPILNKGLVIVAESRGPSVLWRPRELGQLALSMGFYPVSIVEPCKSKKEEVVSTLHNAAVVIGARGGGLASSIFWASNKTTVIEVYADDTSIQQPYSTDKGFRWFDKVTRQRGVKVISSKGTRGQQISFSTLPVQYSDQHIRFILSSLQAL
eukprot:TRINITY_DN3274_c0_g1_i3.p1 TRINITY_DN3274_c0_g1~~TRINITY_DN3274_c0_g1_i3.p1  ORF type:complete len:414 (+),score=52.04 TRINITY_DN3274_c0_g1_i3:1568-2809(+)